MNDIEQRRIKAGLTQEQLAERVGCSQTTIARIEKGAKSRPVLLKAIDAVLESGARVAHAPDRQNTRDASERPLLDTGEAIREATAALHEKTALQSMVIDSQRQIIESQKQTISALQQTIEEMRAARCKQTGK